LLQATRAELLEAHGQAANAQRALEQNVKEMQEAKHALDGEMEVCVFLF